MMHFWNPLLNTPLPKIQFAENSISADTNHSTKLNMLITVSDTCNWQSHVSMHILYDLVITGCEITLVSGYDWITELSESC